ncbi:MAG: TRAP transporter small permease [Gammaproteobacteria bacterium]
MKYVILQRCLAQCLRRLNGFERAVTGVAFAILIAAVFVDVLSREATGTGLHWARQTGVYANVFVVMFGLGLASAGGAHLRPRFTDRWLPARLTPFLDRANDLGMALFCMVFAVIAAGVVAESFELQERSVALRSVVWPFQAAVPAAFLSAGARHLVYAACPGLRPAGAGALASGDEAQARG